MSNSERGGGKSPAAESQHHFSPALIGNDLIRRDFFFFAGVIRSSKHQRTGGNFQCYTALKSGLLEKSSDLE